MSYSTPNFRWHAAPAPFLFAFFRVAVGVSSSRGNAYIEGPPKEPYFISVSQSERDGRTRVAPETLARIASYSVNSDFA